MIAEPLSLDQYTLACLREADPVVQYYRAFFAFLDWSNVEQQEQARCKPGPHPHPKTAYLKAFLVALCEGKRRPPWGCRRPGPGTRRMCRASWRARARLPPRARPFTQSARALGVGARRGCARRARRRSRRASTRVHRARGDHAPARRAAEVELALVARHDRGVGRRQHR